MQQLAPKDTGTFSQSFRIEQTVVRGKPTIRIVSDHPRAKAILNGTKGGYGSIPPWGENTELGGWASRHGFTTARARYMLARKIAVHGTKPAGSFVGLANVTAGRNVTWVTESLREVSK